MNPSGTIHSWEASNHRGLPELGKIKVGMKVERNGREVPEAIDSFLATGKYSHIVHSVLGDKPTRIPVIFTSPNPGHSCNERWEIRKAGKVFAHGDGRVYRYWSQHNGGQYLTKSVSSKEEFQRFHKEISDQCGPKSDWYRALTIRFVIPLPSLPMGEWSFHTKASATSIGLIQQAFQSIPGEQFDMAHIPSMPDIKGAMGILQVEMHQADNQTKSRYPVVSLFPLVSRPGVSAPDVEQLFLASSQEPQLLGPDKANDAEQYMDPPHEEELPVIQIESSLLEKDPPKMREDKPETDFSRARFGENKPPFLPEINTLGEARREIKYSVRMNNPKRLLQVWNRSPYFHLQEPFLVFCLDQLKGLWEQLGGKQAPKEVHDLVKEIKSKMNKDHQNTLANDS